MIDYHQLILFSPKKKMPMLIDSMNDTRFVEPMESTPNEITPLTNNNSQRNVLMLVLYYSYLVF